VNEQPNEYWIAKFESHGRAFAKSHTQAWRFEWEGRGTATWYSRNVMIFVS
jgi:hypothetical protein